MKFICSKCGYAGDGPDFPHPRSLDGLDCAYVARRAPEFAAPAAAADLPENRDMWLIRHWRERAVKAQAALASSPPAPVPEAMEVGEDTKRLDWLETMTVNVRTHLRYGSHNLFWSSPEDLDGDWGPSDIRAKIDAARAQQSRDGED